MQKKITASLMLTGSLFAAVLPAAPPATNPAMMEVDEATRRLRAKASQVFQDLGKNDFDLQAAMPADVLRDPARRRAAAPKVLGLVQERLRLLTEQTKVTPRPIPARELSRIEMLNYLFEEPATVQRINALAGTPAAGKGEGVKLRAAWTAAAGDSARQMEVARQADAVTAKYPADTELTTQIVSLTSSSANVEVRNAVLKTCTETAQNAVAKQVIAELETMKSRQSMQEAAAKQQAYVGQPMTIAGPKVNGGAFTSADWKGRVVLVDFWATWCGPCKAELPHVKALYEKYHDQGFEIVSISADESAEPLTKYVAEHKLDWTHLFDAEAAAKGESSALMKQFNVAALPTMFLIDKNGVCRSVTARNELDAMIPKLLAEPAPTAAAPATQPVATAGPSTQPNLQAQMLSDVGAFQRVFDPKFLADAKAREQSQAAVVPAARKVLQDLVALGDMNPNSAPSYFGGIVFYSTVLAAYGDADGQKWLDEMAKDASPRVNVVGKTQQIYVRWCRSTENVAEQTKVVDDAEALAKANPTSRVLSHQLLKMAGQGASDPALATRLLKLVPESMSNPVAQTAGTIVPLADRVGKPMTLAGTTPAGHAFTTADLKGRVVLVDFWAVWCGPCKRELPRIQAMYDKYHDKGLEVLGVSNDYDAAELNKYVAENKLPWPQLFDAKAAANQAMHPLTSAYFIEGIPTMFLIDKHGVCRSVTARESMEELIPKLLAE